MRQFWLTILLCLTALPASGAEKKPLPVEAYGTSARLMTSEEFRALQRWLRDEDVRVRRMHQRILRLQAVRAAEKAAEKGGR